MGTHVSFMFTGDFNHISGDRNLHFSHGLLGSKGAGKSLPSKQATKKVSNTWDYQKKIITPWPKYMAQSPKVGLYRAYINQYMITVPSTFAPVQLNRFANKNDVMHPAEKLPINFRCLVVIHWQPAPLIAYFIPHISHVWHIYLHLPY